MIAMTDRELLEKILEKVTSIEETVNKNYDKTLEFYGKYKEDMTEISDKLDQLGARQEIFENQTIKNTAELRRIK